MAAFACSPKSVWMVNTPTETLQTSTCESFTQEALLPFSNSVYKEDASSDDDVPASVGEISCLDLVRGML